MTHGCPCPSRRRRWLLCLAVTLLALGALTAPAHASIDLGPVDVPTPGDLLPDIGGGVEDLVTKAVSALLRALFGIEADVGRRAVRWLVAHPVYTDASSYPELNALRRYVTAGGWGLLSLTFTVAAFRYWVSGFTSGGSYEAVEAFVRAGVAAGGLIAFPQLFGYLSVATNMLTSSILAAPGIGDGVAKLMTAAVVSSFAPLGLGTLAQIVAVVCLVLLVVSKIMLATLLAVLYVGAPFALALWPLPEMAWLARTWVQGFIAALLWPVVWSLCFAVFAVMGDSAFSFEGSFGTELVKPWVTVAALYVAFKLPMLIGRQALLAGITPNVGRAGRSGFYAARASGVAGGARTASGSAAGTRGAAAGARAVAG